MKLKQHDSTAKEPWSSIAVVEDGVEYELADGQAPGVLIQGVAHTYPTWPKFPADEYSLPNGTIVQLPDGYTNDPVVVAAFIGWMLSKSNIEEEGAVIMDPVDAVDYIERVQADWGTHFN
jgi:hypothetical protein